MIYKKKPRNDRHEPTTTEDIKIVADLNKL